MVEIIERLTVVCISRNYNFLNGSSYIAEKIKDVYGEKFRVFPDFDTENWELYNNSDFDRHFKLV